MIEYYFAKRAARKRQEGETAVCKNWKYDGAMVNRGFRPSYLSGFGDVIEQAGTHASGASGVTIDLWA